MMLKDEFARLVTLFQEASAGKTVQLEEIFKESLQFFEHLKSQIATGSPEDRQMAMKMMSELYTQMITVSQRIAERSGMTEEQLMAYAENPANFSPLQWSSIQASKEKIAKAGKELVETVEHSLSPGERAAGASKPDAKRSKEMKGKKSKWMRS